MELDGGRCPLLRWDVFSSQQGHVQPVFWTFQRRSFSVSRKRSPVRPEKPVHTVWADVAVRRSDWRLPFIPPARRWALLTDELTHWNGATCQSGSPRIPVLSHTGNYLWMGFVGINQITQGPESISQRRAESNLPGPPTTGTGHGPERSPLNVLLSSILSDCHLI